MNNYQKWFLACRPWSFTMSAISVSVGSALAFVDGYFSWPLYLITLLAMIFMHAATNLINDYYDVLSGVDHSDVSTALYRPHPVLEGLLEPSQVRNVAWVFYGITAVAGTYLAATRGMMILFIGLIGFVASFTYTAPPLKYKYKAMGEFGVFLMWGPLMVEGAYFVQHKMFSARAFWVSLPFGILVALVLLANNIRDIKHDSAKGICTLPIAIGGRNGLRLYLSMIVIAYLSVITMVWWGPLESWSLIVLLSLPLALKLLKQMAIRIPLDADAQTAKLDTVFGVLLVVSLMLGGLS
ncbi:prenyltransferase [Thermodesulfobacteriota bacterium]